MAKRSNYARRPSLLCITPLLQYSLCPIELETLYVVHSIENYIHAAIVAGILHNYLLLRYRVLDTNIVDDEIYYFVELSVALFVIYLLINIFLVS